MTKELYIQNTKIRYLFYLLMSGILVCFLILKAFGTNERDINEVSDMPVLPWFVHLAEIRRQFRKDYRSGTIFRITGGYYGDHLYVTRRLRQ